jgi:hypothetical protein
MELAAGNAALGEDGGVKRFKILTRADDNGVGFVDVTVCGVDLAGANSGDGHSKLKSDAMFFGEEGWKFEQGLARVDDQFVAAPEGGLQSLEYGHGGFFPHLVFWEQG